MSTTLLMLCTLVWLPILVYHIDRRGFVVLLLWLAIAPIASNLVTDPGTNPFFSTSWSQETSPGLKRSEYTKGERYLKAQTTIKLRDLLEPNRLLFGIFFLIFLLDVVLKKRLFSLDRVEIWMAAFSVILLVGALRSTRVAFGVRIAVDAFIVPFLAYYVTRRLVTNEDRLRRLIQVIGGVGFYLIILSLFERLTHSGLYYRLGGPFKSPSFLYIAMALTFFVMLSDALRSGPLVDAKQSLPRCARLSVLYLTPIVVLLTWMRGNWLGFLVSLGVFMLLGRRLTSHSRKLVVAGLLLLSLAVVAIGLQSSATQSVVEDRVTGRNRTVYARFGAWLVALQKGVTPPFLGIGLNDLRGILGTTQLQFNGVKSETTSHNSFLSLFAELGAPGLLAYLTIVTGIVRMGLRLYRRAPHYQDRWWGVAILAIMGAYLAPALTANTLYIPTPGHVYVYAFIGGIAGLYDRPRPVLYVSTRHHRWADTDSPASLR